MCDTPIDFCPYLGQGGGLFSFCQRNNLTKNEIAQIEEIDYQNMSSIYHRLNTPYKKQKLKGIKGNRKTFYPICCIDFLKYSSVIQANINEIRDWLTFEVYKKLDSEVEITTSRFKHKAQYLLADLPTDEQSWILHNWTQRINEIKQRLAVRWESMTDAEIEEFYTLNYRLKSLNAESFIDRDIEYRGLLGLMRFFTKDERKNYKLECLIHPLLKRFDQQYRHGKHWQSIKKKLIEHRGNRCEKCGSTEQIEIHHLVHPLENNEDYLLILCSKCHKEIHYGINKH